MITRFISLSKLETLSFFFFFFFFLLLSLPPLYRCNEQSSHRIETLLSNDKYILAINREKSIHIFVKKKKRKEGIVMEFRDQIVMRFSNQAKEVDTLTWKHPLTVARNDLQSCRLIERSATLRNYDFG